MILESLILQGQQKDTNWVNTFSSKLSISILNTVQHSQASEYNLFLSYMQEFVSSTSGQIVYNITETEGFYSHSFILIQFMANICCIFYLDLQVSLSPH